MAVDPGRLNLVLAIKQGDLTLRTLSIKKDLQIVDDKMVTSSGMISLVVNASSGTSITATRTTFTLADLGVDDCRFVYIEADTEIILEYTSDGLYGVTITPGGSPPSTNTVTGTALKGFNYLTISPPSEDPTGQLVDTNIQKVGTAIIKGKGIETISIMNISGNQSNVRLCVCGYQV